MAGEFIGSKSLPVKSPAGRAQAGRKSRGEQDGKRREQKIALERWEENGTGRKQQNQIGGFTPYSDQRCHKSPPSNKNSVCRRSSRHLCMCTLTRRLCS